MAISFEDEKQCCVCGGQGNIRCNVGKCEQEGGLFYCDYHYAQTHLPLEDRDMIDAITGHVNQEVASYFRQIEYENALHAYRSSLQKIQRLLSGGE